MIGSKWSNTYFNPQLPRRKRRWHSPRLMPTSSISIHSFLVESDQITLRHSARYAISIHSFLVESDPIKPPLLPSMQNFNPQLPRRKRPLCTVISIHSFLVESDDVAKSPGSKPFYFNPQLPRRKRQAAYLLPVCLCTFQSTASS